MSSEIDFEAEAPRDDPDAKLAAANRFRMAISILRQLLDADDSVRRQGIEEARRVPDKYVTYFCALDLITQLKDSKGEMRKHAEEALLAIGARACIPIWFSLMKFRGKKIRLRLIEMLAEIGRELDGEDRDNVSRVLVYVANHTRSQPVIKACIEATVRVREKDDLDDLRLNRLVHDAEWRLLTTAQYRVLHGVDERDLFDAFGAFFVGGGLG